MKNYIKSFLPYRWIILLIFLVITQKETVRSKTYSSNTKRKGNTILLGGIGNEEDIRLHKRIPRKIKKRLMGLEIIKKSKLRQKRCRVEEDIKWEKLKKCCR